MEKKKKSTKFFVTLLCLVCFGLLTQGTVIAKEQATCPLMGGKINKDIYADHAGKRVYFCCAGCIAPFKKDPEKYIKKLESEGVELAKAPEETEQKKDHEGHKHD